MLHDFLKTHRTELIARCRAAIGRRRKPGAGPAALDHGIPEFLDQLMGLLRQEQAAAALKVRVDRAVPMRWLRDDTRQVDTAEIAVTARGYGLDLSRDGFTVEQVIHNYGDLFGAITGLAGETKASITLNEFTTLHRCLDDAIAGAVTEYCFRRDALLLEEKSRLADERSRVLLQSLQAHVETATLAIAAIGTGNIGLKGATGSILGVSLDSMRALIERSMADARGSIGLLARH